MNDNQGKSIVAVGDQPGKSVLELRGNGVIIDAEGDGSYFYAVIKNGLRVTLDGKDITDSVKWADDYEAFIANKILEEESCLDFYILNEEVELPRAVFFLPEEADPNLIQLLPINRDFADLYEDGTVADFIIYDGEEVESESYCNNDGLLNIEYDGCEYDDNRTIYSEIGCDGDETKLFR